MQKAVDVIIPMYNSRCYISSAIESAIDQTYTNLRVIVVDDGSTDGSAEIVRGWCSKHPDRVFYHFQANQGPAAARNSGITQAKGTYIAFLDADDRWHLDKIRQQVELLDRSPQVGLVYSDSEFVDTNYSCIPSYVRQIRLVRGDVLSALFAEHFILTPTVLIRRSCIDEIGGFRETLRVGEDYEFFLRVAKRFEVDFIPQKLLYRVVRPDSLSRENMILDATTDLKTLRRFLRDNPDFYRANRSLVHRRLSDCHFSFAYQLLECGRNLLALRNVVQSLTYRFSGKALKNLLLCFLPLRLRQSLKRKYAAS